MTPWFSASPLDMSAEVFGLRGQPPELVIDHPNYRARAEISHSTRHALIDDLAD